MLAVANNDFEEAQWKVAVWGFYITSDTFFLYSQVGEKGGKEEGIKDGLGGKNNLKRIYFATY